MILRGAGSECIKDFMTKVVILFSLISFSISAYQRLNLFHCDDFYFLHFNFLLPLV